MIRQGLCVLLFVIILPCFVLAQDSLTFKPQAYGVSAGLLLGGIMLNDKDTKHDIRDWIKERISTRSNLDDYLQYAPIGMMYLSDLALGSDRGEVMRQTRHLMVSQGLTLGMVYLLKQVTKEVRPSGGSRSFPSGHTAFVFAGATVMFHGFKGKNKWLAYSGFVPAIIVGGYRIIRDKHWVSDVTFGAGLGILCGYLTYDLDLWHSKRAKMSHGTKSMAATFRIGTTSNGIGAYLDF